MNTVTPSRKDYFIDAISMSTSNASEKKKSIKSFFNFKEVINKFILSSTKTIDVENINNFNNFNNINNFNNLNHFIDSITSNPAMSDQNFQNFDFIEQQLITLRAFIKES